MQNHCLGQHRNWQHSLSRQKKTPQCDKNCSLDPADSVLYKALCTKGIVQNTTCHQQHGVHLSASFLFPLKQCTRAPFSDILSVRSLLSIPMLHKSHSYQRHEERVGKTMCGVTSWSLTGALFQTQILNSNFSLSSRKTRF